MNRGRLITEVDRRLGNRRLVWFGTRGDDVESVTDLPQMDTAFSFIGTYSKRPSIRGLSLEDVDGVRVDLDTYDIDDHLRSPAVRELRSTVLRALSGPSALFTYRPTTFTSALGFARNDRCTHLGLFKGHQSAFEHKPWLECALATLGIPRVPWRYISDADQLDTIRLLADGPVMLRRSRTTGGVGLARVDAEDRLAELWLDEDEAYVSVAPFIDGTPVNVGAVAWHDGVTVHPASVQLIGVPSCTGRPFGYCGNDFGAVETLGEGVLDAIQDSVTAIGHHLRRFGFLGAFGVDFLVDEGVPLFTEVNPRFQGSTHASAQISVEHDESCLLLEHLAAHLIVDAPPSRKLLELAPADGFSHMVVHHTGAEPSSISPDSLVANAAATRGFCRADVLTNPGLTTQPGSTVARITVRDRVTERGFSLLEPWSSVVTAEEYARSPDPSSQFSASGRLGATAAAG